MAIDRFLAMTAAEIQFCPRHCGPIAYLACHFSPYNRGLSNLPRELPRGSLLLLDDSTPICGHDPQLAAQQLAEAAKNPECRGVLLDFQRTHTEEAAAMAAFLCRALPCPVAVSSLYAGPLSCAVCVPPPDCHIPLEEHLAPWKGREIWLELALDGETIALSGEGAQFRPLTTIPQEEGFFDPTLNCRYRIQQEKDRALFTLWRTKDSLRALEAAAEALGVTLTVGLWQELSG